MEKPSVSVIIPFYNTEKVLFERCIKSVLSQTYDNYECLIIDDGSRQEYETYLDDFSIHDSRIVVFHKDNSGLGSTRNYGVSKARGNFVFFLDADDYISPYTLEIGMRLARETQVDMIVGGLIHVADDEILEFQNKENNKTIVRSHADKVSYIMHICGIKRNEYALTVGQVGMSACSKFVKLDIAKQIQFENDRYWDEDNLWNILMANQCNKILVVDVCWYAYVINPNSMIRSYTVDRTEEFQFRAKQEYNLIKSLYPDCIQGAYCQIWDGLLRYCRTDVFHTENPNCGQVRYRSFCNAIDFNEFRETIENIDFNFERRRKYRLVKKIIKKLLGLKYKRLAYIALEKCIKRIKF